MNDTLIRIEYKLDLVIAAMQSAGIMVNDLPSMDGIESDLCPVCANKIRIVVDAHHGNIFRNCGCKLPKTAYSLNSILTQDTKKEADNASNREQEIQFPSE